MRFFAGLAILELALDGNTEMAELLLKAARCLSFSSSCLRVMISNSFLTISAYLSAIKWLIDELGEVSCLDILF